MSKGKLAVEAIRAVDELFGAPFTHGVSNFTLLPSSVLAMCSINPMC